MNNKEKLNAFKQTVIENCNNKDFVYNEFFVNDHLLITEKIALELCDIYKEANRDIVFALVWFHDFGKPIDIKNERTITRDRGSKTMKQFGLADDFIDQVVKLWEKMEMKNEIDLSKECIEVRIVSSADGASHFVGKFFSTYFHDEPDELIKNIEQRIKNKIRQDWGRKIVLPEVKQAFFDRYIMALEIVGEYPDKFI